MAVLITAVAAAVSTSCWVMVLLLGGRKWQLFSTSSVDTSYSLEILVIHKYAEITMNEQH